MTSVFRRNRLTAAEALEQKVLGSPFYPFTLDPSTNLLTFRRRKLQFWFGVVGLVVSSAALIALVATGNWPGGGLLYACLVEILSIFICITDRRPCVYVLDHKRAIYQFKYGDELVQQSKLHNICIRLRKRIVTGRPYYYIILFGLHIDRQILSGTSTKRVEMRRVAQKIASNLHLNYFDDSDISQHHRVVHYRD